jgi:hypothetical protein
MGTLLFSHSHDAFSPVGNDVVVFFKNGGMREGPEKDDAVA